MYVQRKDASTVKTFAQENSLLTALCTTRACCQELVPNRPTAQSRGSLCAYAGYVVSCR